MRIAHHKARWVVIVAAIILGLGLLILGAWYIAMSLRQPSTIQPAPITKPAPHPVSLSSNTLYTGNIFWGRYINDWSMASPLKTAYPFSRLNEFHRENYDAWIGGLECPTVPGDTQTSAQQEATLSFNCSPDYLPEFKKWFSIVTLANNHTDNRGVEGFDETKRQLDAVGIQYFGHYDPYVADDACEVVALPVTVTYSDQSKQSKKLPVAMCGFHGVFKIPPADTIAQIQKYAPYMPVIAMPHMGVEYVATPNQLKTSTYRAMIDAGADMVLGDHPHWVQTTEAYKGKLIVYSMGNFMFDQQGSKELTRSAAINVVMNTTDVDSTQLARWVALGEWCGTFKDDCLAQAKLQNLSKIPMSYKFGVVGTNDDSKITKPATEAQTAEILDRLQWAKTMSQLQSPQGSL